jgi:hypothetical protein
MQALRHETRIGESPEGGKNDKRYANDPKENRRAFPTPADQLKKEYRKGHKAEAGGKRVAKLVQEPRPLLVDCPEPERHQGVCHRFQAEDQPPFKIGWSKGIMVKITLLVMALIDKDPQQPGKAERKQSRKDSDQNRAWIAWKKRGLSP